MSAVPDYVPATWSAPTRSLCECCGRSPACFRVSFLPGGAWFFACLACIPAPGELLGEDVQGVAVEAYRP